MKNNTLNLTDYQNRSNQCLKQWLPDATSTPQRLHEAMQYSVFNGGKRLRPILVYITGECFGGTLEQSDTAAAAVELIHCYSLIHDDLPAMDDDDLRRGKPTCHNAFDEATAILAGDALQSLAFELLATRSQHLNPLTQLDMLKALANASGSIGMAGGQMLDLQSEGKQITIAQLESVHQLKTGALFRTAVRLGALSAGCNDTNKLSLLDQFAKQIGLAFQIQDDILDIESSTDVLGKTAGADAAHKKATYPGLSNLQSAKEQVTILTDDAIAALTCINENTSKLAELSYLLTKRDS